MKGADRHQGRCGLAAGKGVIVMMTLEEAEAAFMTCWQATPLATRAAIVIEKFLDGEASFIVMVDGEHVLPMAASGTTNA